MATTPKEEWLDYLKNNRIKDDTSTPGLREARQKLLYMTMNDKERQAYDAHMDDIMVQNDMFYTARMEGLAEGRAEGRAEGKYMQLIEMVCRKLKKGKDASAIADELDENPKMIDRICQAAAQTAPDYDYEQIWESLDLNLE